MDHQHQHAFFRKIKLVPAIGDWTTIQYHDPDQEETRVSQITNINFDRLPKEQLSYVHYLHYRLAEDIAKDLADGLDISVELHSISAKQMAYQDFVTLQTDPMLQAHVPVLGSGTVSLFLDWGFSEMIASRLTGGGLEESGSTSFSTLELAVLKTQVLHVVPLLDKAWKSVMGLSSEAVDVKAGQYRPDKRLSPRDALVIFTFYFQLGKDDVKSMSVAYPTRVLRKLLGLRKALPDPVKRRVFLSPETLKKLKVPVKAVLGETTITMADFRQLQVGDVIGLDATLDHPVSVSLGDDVQLFAQPGVVNQKSAVQLLWWTPSDAKETHSVDVAPVHAIAAPVVAPAPAVVEMPAPAPEPIAVPVSSEHDDNPLDLDEDDHRPEALEESDMTHSLSDEHEHDDLDLMFDDEPAHEDHDDAHAVDDALTHEPDAHDEDDFSWDDLDKL
ncbi:MAG: FliM/FliN family flagellar motor switch protein [Candidatus Margulisiibacteriota bacterium]